MVVRRGGEGRAEEDCWHRKKSLALQADSGHPQESQPGGSRSRAAGEHSAEEISGAGQHHFLLSCRAGSGGVLPSHPDPRPGSLVHRQELWAGSQKPWVLILVLQCGCASVNHSCQNGGKGCPGFLPVRSRNGRMHGERKKKKGKENHSSSARGGRRQQQRDRRGLPGPWVPSASQGYCLLCSSVCWRSSCWPLSHRAPRGWHVRPRRFPLLHQLSPPGAPAQEQETGPRASPCMEQPYRVQGSLQ